MKQLLNRTCCEMIFFKTQIPRSGINFQSHGFFFPFGQNYVICRVSVQALRPLKDSAFVVFEGESFRGTLLTSSAVVKCDGRAFAASPGCVTRCFTLTSQFLPPSPAKVTIYATRCRHFLSFFLLFQAGKASWDM